LGLLTLSLGVVALWVSSYSGLGLVNGKLPAKQGFVFQSWKGQLRSMWYSVSNRIPESRWALSYSPAPEWERMLKVIYARQPPESSILGFRARVSFDEWRVAAPYWFLFLVFATLAFALKPKPRLKISLADLLLLMTFFAVLIAGVAGLSRLAS
jgi:hypothetical protein